MQDIILFKQDLPDNFDLSGDIAIDTETMGLNLLRDRLCLLQFSNGDGQAYIVQFNNDYRAPNLKKLLSNPKTTKIFHYARFDIAVIYQYLNISINNIFCTKIASKLVRTYTDSHGLKELCRELLAVQLSKQQQSSNWGEAHLTNEQLSYAAKDVLYLHQLREILINRLVKEDRSIIAQELFNCLMVRAKLDLLGWQDVDIFMH